jgi:hypothetical protein
LIAPEFIVEERQIEVNPKVLTGKATRNIYARMIITPLGIDLYISRKMIEY